VSQALLDRMRRDPLDWTISDVEAVCRQHGAEPIHQSAGVNLPSDDRYPSFAA
jgi:hypothetical protein